MKQFPDIKKDIHTVAIAGFPNVGKTTLLYKLTGSKAEIKEYPFTTKGVNVSYLEGIQLLDTPGTLNRLNKMNPIEKVAYTAIKHCADLIVYVFDPTEEYPIAKQIKLLSRLKDFEKKIIIYIAKTDIADEDKVEEIKEKFEAIDEEKLKEVITNYFSK